MSSKAPLKIAFSAFFLNDESSVARRRQLRQLKALESLGEVEVFGPAAPLPVNLNASKDRPKQPGLKDFLKTRLRRLNNLRIRYGAFRSSRFPDGHEFSSIAAAWRSKTEFDLIVASYGPWSSLLTAAVLKAKNRNSKLILDYRDLFTANPFFIGIPGFRSLERAFDSWIQRNSAAISTVSLGLAEELTEGTAVIYNGPYLDNCSASASNVAPLSASVQSDSLAIGYFGTYYSKYSITPLIKTINETLEHGQLNFVLAGDSLILADQLGQAKLQLRSKTELNVRSLGFISSAQVETAREHLDLELFFTMAEHAKGILSSKIFDLIKLNIPVLVVGNCIDRETCLLLNSLKQVIYCNGSVCLIEHDLASRKIFPDFESFYRGHFIRH